MRNWIRLLNPSEFPIIGDFVKNKFKRMILLKVCSTGVAKWDFSVSLKLDRSITFSSLMYDSSIPMWEVGNEVTLMGKEFKGVSVEGLVDDRS